MPFIYLESHLRNSKERGRTQWWGLHMHFNSFRDVFPSENSLSLWIIRNFEVIKPSCSSRKNSLVNWEPLNIYVLVFIILGSPVRAEWWVKAAKIIFFPVNMCTQSYLTLCNSMDHSLPGSSVHGILQAILEWVAIFSSRESSQPMEQTCISCIADRLLTCWTIRKTHSSPNSPCLRRVPPNERWRLFPTAGLWAGLVIHWS